MGYSYTSESTFTKYMEELPYRIVDKQTEFLKQMKKLWWVAVTTAPFVEKAPPARYTVDNYTRIIGGTVGDPRGS